VTGLAVNAFHSIVEDQLSTGVAGAPPGLAYRLHPNAPNPFNPSTRISFEIPRAERLSVTVYDTRGRAVAVLADGAYPAGRFDLVWDGTDRSGREAPSGIYLARMTAGSFSEARRLVLLR